MTTAIAEAPWAPFEPSAGDPWDPRKVAHLHRRAGFGATRDELARDLADGPGPSVDRLLNSPGPTADERAVLDGLREGALRVDDLRRLKAYWLYRMRFGPGPLREKLTLFWHGHFATSIAKVRSAGAMAQQIETIREHALGPFPALLTAMVADPAMLVWLDGGTSRKERPNENFAREFLELFTLGPGAYTEADIREAARAFTGWTPEAGRRSPAAEAPKFAFAAGAHDDGPKTILGQSGAWAAADVVRIALGRPEAARSLASKLYRAFVAEEPEPAPGLIESLADELRSSGYSIRHALATILRSRHFYSAAYRRRIKSPVEYVVGLARSLEVPRPGLNLLALAAACDRQGQELFAPPNVKGWDGGMAWINSATLLERLNWASDVAWGNPEAGQAAYDPAAWAESRGVKREEAAQALVDLLLQDDLAPESRALILDAGRDGDPDGLRKALQAVVHCPDFQLA